MRSPAIVEKGKYEIRKITIRWTPKIWLFWNQTFPRFSPCETIWRKTRESLNDKKFVQIQVTLILIRFNRAKIFIRAPRAPPWLTFECNFFQCPIDVTKTIESRSYRQWFWSCFSELWPLKVMQVLCPISYPCSIHWHGVACPDLNAHDWLHSSGRLNSAQLIRCLKQSPFWKGWNVMRKDRRLSTEAAPRLIGTASASMIKTLDVFNFLVIIELPMYRILRSGVILRIFWGTSEVSSQKYFWTWSWW